MHTPIKDPTKEAARRLEDQQSAQLNYQIDTIASLESKLKETEEALARAEQKLGDLSVKNNTVLLNAFRLTVFEATGERVYLATDDAPAITHFMIERSQFTVDADIRPGSVMMVKISATLLPLPMPSPDEQQGLRHEMATIAEELDQHTLSGPVTL